MRLYGWKPSLFDSEYLWTVQRKKASEIGEQAAILVGASRLQLGIDLVTLENEMALKPIQLAIDGSPFMPVLKDLANDNKVKGIIILDVIESDVRLYTEEAKSDEWIKYYHKHAEKFIEPYMRFNNLIKFLIGSHMVTKLEGARPYTVISHFLFNPNGKGNYLITNHDRSRNADYSKVDLPSFYAARVQRHYGGPLIEKGMTFDRFKQKTEDAIINQKQPSDIKNFMLGLEQMIKYIGIIEKRGGNVFIVRFPTDKLIWEIDKRTYPKEFFWKKIEQRHHRTIHFADYKDLSSYNLPDGSHLDFRDKKKFTVALSNIIKQMK